MLELQTKADRSAERRDAVQELTVLEESVTSMLGADDVTNECAFQTSSGN